MQYFLHTIPPVNATQVLLQDPNLHRMAIVALALKLYYIPIMSILGVILNGLMIATFCLTKIRKFSYAPYISGLATSDSVFLLLLLLVWLKEIDIDIYNKEGWCQAITYISSVTAFLSLWYTVAYVVDRFICLTFPHEKKKMCTAFRGKMVILGLAMAAIAVYLNLSLLSGVVTSSSGDICVGIHTNAAIVLSKMDIFFNLFLPYSALITLSIGIMLGIKRTTYRRKSFRPTPGTRARDSNNRSTSIKTTRRKGSQIMRCLGRKKEHVTTSLRDIHTSKSLLLFGLTFIVLTLPSQLLQLYTMMCSYTQERFTITNYVFLWQQISLCLFYSRCALNFPLYMCTSVLFRNAFRLLFAWPCRPTGYFSAVRNMSIRYSRSISATDGRESINGVTVISSVRGKENSRVPLTGSEQIVELGL